ncbi:MAG: pirin family protein [Thermaurantimonas sp.]
MKINIIKSENRGKSDIGWLKTRYSFSFSNYYNPHRMHFGKLRVLNDDQIAAGMGFGMHPHDNMEIITIPTKGALKHQDSMGNSATVHSGEVQVMSAGKGIYHSEINPYNEPVELFQIWIFPNVMNVDPRYDQMSYHKTIEPGQWTLIVGPKGFSDRALWIYQDAFISIYGASDTPSEATYYLKNPNNGVYLMVIEGGIQFNDIHLTRRDSLEVSEVDSLQIGIEPLTTLLAIEVPMN